MSEIASTIAGATTRVAAYVVGVVPVTTIDDASVRTEPGAQGLAVLLGAMLGIGVLAALAARQARRRR
ncbi:MAG: hypothetical protein KDB40_21790 [Acidimicrobiales bacterium]|nr:hypothetical protein [Acidimicrobiales bacterium]MCB9395988.1 hypothetical protein [Acidimicrobiaceae bacterium]